MEAPVTTAGASHAHSSVNREWRSSGRSRPPTYGDVEVAMVRVAMQSTVIHGRGMERSLDDEQRGHRWARRIGERLTERQESI
jgi:hypothetical protein